VFASLNLPSLPNGSFHPIYNNSPGRFALLVQ
jgi:hypothetical protein